MEGMTEEQKEIEAMKLVEMFDRLSRSMLLMFNSVFYNRKPYNS